MREINGDIWDYHTGDSWIAITTNGSVRHDGKAVMGRGVALQAARRFFNLQSELGNRLKSQPVEIRPTITIFPEQRLLCLPVKYHWQQRADIHLIARSCNDMERFLRLREDIPALYMVRPGCGNGQLTWGAVKPVIEPIFDHPLVRNRVVIVERG